MVGFAHSGWGLQVKGDTLPTDELPPFDGIGANEYVVDVTHDAVDFISTVDTPPVWELNIWYHTLNVGFRTRISGETDFPVHLRRSRRPRPQLRPARSPDRTTAGRGHSRRPRLRHRRQEPPDRLPRQRSRRRHRRQRAAADASRARCTVRALVAARLDERTDGAIRGKRGDEKPYWDLERARIGEQPRSAGRARRQRRRRSRRSGSSPTAALREVSFPLAIERSSWVALRILPSSHTNPIFVPWSATADPRVARRARSGASSRSIACGRRRRRGSRRASAMPPPRPTNTRARSTSSVSARRRGKLAASCANRRILSPSVRSSSCGGRRSIDAESTAYRSARERPGVCPQLAA